MAKKKSEPEISLEDQALMTLMWWYKAETVKIVKAPCSGPRLFWNSERDRMREELLKLAEKLSKTKRWSGFAQ